MKSHLLTGFSKRGFKKGIKKFLYDSDFVKSIEKVPEDIHFPTAHPCIVKQMEELLD
ncbi:hypothetical protein [Chryseobacterium potabilaquae]|uniref:hypothetical protein n=1 Tax=Chryseobacterium potabilaquae TaxID=2675057 RepID=UPI0013894389|nr:hypothetical protein [Chryseobacterium potabilaquae]